MSSERVKEGFDQVTNSVCVVAYDPSGAPVSEKLAEEIVEAVTKVTEENKLTIMVARQ